ncbi:MAG: polysaccharide deacetylase [Spirochaetales bacterium]|nr:polysaccharide deacetylase [Spirochaetales bacterium]
MNIPEKMINRGRRSDIPTWPDGKRIAVLIAFDIDADTMWYTHADHFNGSISDLSRGVYGPKQGVPRILDMLDRQKIKATFFVPGVVAEMYPDIVKEVALRGHEIGYHGYLHEESTKTTYEEENATMLKAEKIILDLTGQRLRGHRGPGGVFHDYSLRLFVEHGYIHSSNFRDADGPFIHRENGKRVPVVELPKDSVFDDTAYDFYTETPPERYELKSPREMYEIWKDEFDALSSEGRMMNFVLHPQFFGRACRVRMLSDLIDYMRENGAWFATNAECAEYVLKQNGML